MTLQVQLSYFPDSERQMHGSDCGGAQAGLRFMARMPVYMEPIASSPLVKSAYQNNIFLISQPKHMLWGLKITRLNETVLLSTQKPMLKLMGKKIFTIVC